MVQTFSYQGHVATWKMPRILHQIDKVLSICVRFCMHVSEKETRRESCLWVGDSWAASFLACCLTSFVVGCAINTETTFS